MPILKSYVKNFGADYKPDAYIEDNRPAPAITNGI